MAPIDSKLPSSSSSKQKNKAPISDDDVIQWDDLTDLSDTEDYPKVPMKTPSNNPPPPQGMHYGLDYPPGLLHQQPADPINRTLPTAQHKLEARLLHLAEVDLGLHNAISILDRHLVEEPVEDNDTIQISSGLMNRPMSYPGPPNPYGGRYNIYSTERTYASAVLKDMGYLLGLKKAVKILKDALADKDRVDVKYKLKVIQPPPLPTPPPPMPQMCSVNMPMQLPQYAGSMSMTTMQEQLRVVAKDIMKDTVKECKNEGAAATESVQQEMIKLLRDVCRDALQKKE